MFDLSVYYLFIYFFWKSEYLHVQWFTIILFNESTKSNPHSLAYWKIKKELNQTHATKSNPPMKSIQTHATKSNLPMKLSTHAKKTKGKKGTMEIFWLWHCQQCHCRKERKGERDEAGTNGATRNKDRKRD